MPSTENETTDWLAVADTAHAWMRMTSDVKKQLWRDREIGKIAYPDWSRVWGELNRAWEVSEAECSVAFALHSAQRIEVPLETIVADLRRDQQ